MKRFFFCYISSATCKEEQRHCKSHSEKRICFMPRKQEKRTPQPISAVSMWLAARGDRERDSKHTLEAERPRSRWQHIYIYMFHICSFTTKKSSNIWWCVFKLTGALSLIFLFFPAVYQSQSSWQQNYPAGHISLLLLLLDSPITMPAYAHMPYELSFRGPKK